MKKTTTFKLGDSTISVESDDSQIPELIARLLVEKATAGMTSAPQSPVTSDLVEQLVEGCGENETQRGVLRALKKGWATRAEMRRAVAKGEGSETEGNRKLSGCRGSIGKRAKRLGFGPKWWTDAYSPEHKDFVATLREDVAEHLKKIDF